MSELDNIPDTEIDERVAGQLARSNIFSRRTPARFEFLLHEFVLRLPVGGPVVMSDQLHHVLRMSVRPYISIKVVPAAIGAHAGLAGSFTLMTFNAIKPVVYLEGATHAVFLEEPEELGAYRGIFAALVQASLDEEQSRVLIRNLAVEIYGDREEEHGLA